MNTLVKSIEAIRINNPFEPSDRDVERWAFETGYTLANYFPTDIGDAWLVMCNGQRVLPEAFALTTLNQTDQIVVCPIPHGSGGKSILRLVALLAVAVAAPYAAAALMSTTVAGLGVAGTFLAAGISIAGGMLVNALLPAAKATAGSTLADSPTYGIDGAKNTSLEGVPVPIAYGRFRMAGNIISNYVVNDGNTQILYMLLNAGEGPIASISDVKINDEDYTTFGAELIMDRLGYPEQLPIGWFENQVTPVSVDLEIGASDWMVRTTSTEVDKLRLDFAFPNGLGKINASGGIDKQTVDLIVQIKPYNAPDSSYTDINGGAVTSYRATYSYYTYSESNNDDPFTVIGNTTQDTLASGTNVIGNLIYQGDRAVGFVNQIPVTTGSVSFTDAVRSTLRKSIEVNSLAEGKYVLRFRRATAKSTDVSVVDQIYLTDINEIVTDPVSYNNTALLAIKVTLTDQLNSIPTVTFMNGGRLIRSFNSTTNQYEQVATANPAWVTLDILTHGRYGAGIADARIDIPQIRYWADFCDANGLTYNGVFDTTSNIWDSLTYVTRVGHAQIVPIGTRYSVVIEKADLPVMMFSVANMVQGSFKETWLPMANRSNEIEIQYYDQTDDYKEHTVRVINPDEFNGDQQRSSSITMYGIVDAERAYAEGMLQLRLNQYVLRTVDFSAPIEALACTVGSLVYVQHDMPQWGYAGRTAAGSTTNVINLDRPVTMTSDKNYHILVHYDAVQRMSGTIQAIAGLTLYLGGGGLNYGNVRRIQVAGLDLEVVSYFTMGTNLCVTVNATAGLAVGQPFTLWDTDVLDERQVNVADGDFTQVTVSQAFASAPDAFRSWMFGPVDKIKRPFRIKSITANSDDMTRQVTAIEYNASVYDLTNPVVVNNYSDIPVIQNVTIDGVTEDTISSISTNTSVVTVKFQGTGVFAKAHGWVSRNGQPWEDIGYAMDRFTINATEGESLVFRIQAMDALGATPPLSTAPTISYTVLGYKPAATQAALTAPGGFSATGALASVILNWNAGPAGVAGTEIWRSADNILADAKLLDTVEGNLYVDMTGQTGLTYYYWVRFYTIGVNPLKSPYAGPYAATTQKINYANFADTIEPVTLVDTLPTTRVTANVFYQGHLYQWNGTQYVQGTTGTGGTISAEDIIGQIQAGQLAIDSVIAGTIAAGAVSASELAVGSVRAQHVLIAARGLNLDPMMKSLAWRNELASVASTDPSVPAGCPQPYAAKFNGRDCINFTSTIYCTPGEQYKVSITANVATTGLNASAMLYQYDVAGNVIATPIGPQISGQGWQTSIATITIPPNCAYFAFGPWIGQAQNGTGVCWFTNLTVEKLNDASLVIDGSLTANKIDTRGLTIKDLAGNVLFGAGTGLDYSSIANAPINFRVGSLGYIQNGLLGFFRDPLPQSYNVTYFTFMCVEFDRLGNNIDNASFATQSDAVAPNYPAGTPLGVNAAQAMATWINNRPVGHYIAIFTYNNPGDGKSNAALRAAIMDIGGSPAVWDPAWAFRDSYILVGRRGLGAGNGLERRLGNDGSLELAFSMSNGTITGMGTGGAKTIQDYGYTGDLNATNGATFGSNIFGQITAANATTYIQAAALGSAVIGLAAIGSAQIADIIQSDNWDGTNGWAILKRGDAYFGNVRVRGDIQATSISAQSINIVSTGNIQGNAVTYATIGRSDSPVGLSATSYTFVAGTGFIDGSVGSLFLIVNVNPYTGLVGNGASGGEGGGGGYTTTYPQVVLFRNGQPWQTLFTNTGVAPHGTTAVFQDTPGAGVYYEIYGISNNGSGSGVTSSLIYVTNFKK